MGILSKFKSDRDSEICKVKQGTEGYRYFIFRCIKYSYNHDENEFTVKELTIGKTKAQFHSLGLGGLSSRDAANRLKLCGLNKIDYSLPHILTSIWDELFNFFYLYQLIFLWVWYFNYYWVLAVAVNVLIAFAAIIGIVTKRSAQKDLVELSKTHTMVSTKRDNKWVNLSSHYLVPGDIIQLKSGELTVSDNILMTGRAVINESSLTGEPAPVPKMSLPNDNDFYGHSSEDMKYTILSGTVIESVSHDTNGNTCAIVLSTGINTKQGKLLLSMLFPPKLRFKFETDFSLVFLLLFIFGLACILIVGYLMHWVAMSVFYGIFTLSHALNPILPAMFTTAQSQCVAALKKKNIRCLEIARTFVAAKVKTFCFDKTGTLTKQGMEFFGLSKYDADNAMKFSTKHENTPHILKMLMGSCHELDFITDSSGKLHPIGNEVDIALFENSTYELVDQIEDVTYLKDSLDNSTIKILKRFEFSRETMSMSSVVEDITTGTQYLFTKGSFDHLLSLANPSSLTPELTQYNIKYAMKGHYLLGIAYKILQKGFDYNQYSRSELECNFIFSGFLHFKNHLKEDTSEVIEHLKQGKINCVMITGDNIFTACNIAQECAITGSRIILCDMKDENQLGWMDFSTQHYLSFDEIMDLFKAGKAEQAITYKAFDFLRLKSTSFLQNLSQNKKLQFDDIDAMRFLLPYTKIFARMKPDHKVKAVRMQMHQSITGMCGDGANDAAALRLAHCGIAISTGNGRATIVAPFSTSSDSLKAVIEVIRYGRSTLATALAVYKRTIVAGLTTVIMKLFLYHFSLQISEVTWMFLDGIFNIGISLCLLRSKPAKRLTASRPTSSLFSLDTLTSIIGQTIIVFFTFLISFMLLMGAEFYACRNFDTSLADLTKWWTMGDNFEATLCSLIILFIIIAQGFLYNLGYKYRTWWFKNYYLLSFLAICFIITMFILLGQPSFISCLMRINCGDHTLLEAWDKLDLIEYDGSVPLVPPGCACSEQLVVTPTCDSPYINCLTEHYNTDNHHTIFPTSFRYQLLGIFLGYFIVSIVLEWLIIHGPIRSYLIKKKHMKKALKL